MEISQKLKMVAPFRGFALKGAMRSNWEPQNFAPFRFFSEKGAMAGNWEPENAAPF
jgi:hypothetical protein